MANYKKITAEQERIIREHYERGDKCPTKLSKMLGLSMGTIAHKAYDMGFRGDGYLWKAQDVRRVLDEFPMRKKEGTLGVLAKELGRSERAITIKFYEYKDSYLSCLRK